MAPYIFFGAGLLFLFYFIIICVHCGYAPDFSWFWSVGGILLLFLGRFADTLLFICFLLIILGFSFSFFVLAKQGNSRAGDGAEYVIVLGAKVNGTVPSLALQERIKEAYEYLSRNEHTKAILTGGKGKGEDISEAFAMEQQLIQQGILKERLYLEDKSKTTLENIKYAKKFIAGSNRKIVIITSDFHTLRGRTIAKAAGFTKVETIGARSSAVMSLHYYTRETLSWVKYGTTKIRK